MNWIDITKRSQADEVRYLITLSNRLSKIGGWRYSMAYFVVRVAEKSKSWKIPNRSW